jgi:hypothetical protein
MEARENHEVEFMIKISDFVAKPVVRSPSPCVFVHMRHARGGHMRMYLTLALIAVGLVALWAVIIA